MRGAKSANSNLFKDFCNVAEMEKNKLDGGIYFINVTKFRPVCFYAFKVRCEKLGASTLLIELYVGMM